MKEQLGQCGSFLGIREDKITLPNLNYTDSKSEVDNVVQESGTKCLSSKEEKILNFLNEHRFITRKEVQELLETSQSSAGRVLKSLVDGGKIAQIGGSRSIRYELLKK